MSPALPNGKPKRSAGKIASIVLAAIGIYNGLGAVVPHNRITDSVLVALTAGLAGLVDPRKKKQ